MKYILGKSKLLQFKCWLLKNKWIVCDNIQPCDVLTVRRNSRQYPLVISTTNHSKDYYGVHDRDVAVVNKFMRDLEMGRCHE